MLFQSALQFWCINFSFTKGMKLLFTLLKPVDQVSMFLQKLGQLILQGLRLSETVLKQKTDKGDVTLVLSDLLDNCIFIS